ncbi:hypothetical protein DITRI_Ditri12bG0007900 [Diplodiscus trichospermus]
MEGESTNSSEKTKPMGRNRTAKRKITLRELKADMALICEEQKSLREGQREVQQKFQKIESRISLLRQEGNPALFFKYQ